MDLTSQTFEDVFQKLGVELVSGSEHRCGFFVVDGVRVLTVHHHTCGPATITGTAVQLFRKSLKLSEPEFKALVGCTLSREQFVTILRRRGHLRDVER